MISQLPEEEQFLWQLFESQRENSAFEDFLLCFLVYESKFVDNNNTFHTMQIVLVDSFSYLKVCV